MNTSIVAADRPEILVADRQIDPATSYIASLSPGSRRVQAQSLRVIAEIIYPGSGIDDIDWACLRNQHVQAIRAVLAEKYRPSTANRHLSALRGVIRHTWILGLITAEEKERALLLRPIGGSTVDESEKGHHLTHGELDAFFRTCYADKTAIGVRDSAIIAIAYTCGLRRSEIADLLVEDYDRKEERLTVRHGKGNKERVVPLHSQAISLIDSWLELRDANTSNESFCPNLFLKMRKGGGITQKRLTDTAIYRIVISRLSTAGIFDASPHDLRRTFAGNLLENGADIAVAQRLMGHSSPKTTSRYDKRGFRSKRKAIETLHIPAMQ